MSAALSSQQIPFPAAFDFSEIFAHERVLESDVLALRRLFFADGIVDPSEAEALFEIEQRCETKDASWSQFFVEALTDYVVHQAEPAGYVSIENADWLMERVSADGVIAGQTELSLLIEVLDEARFVPEALITFVLDAIKTAVLKPDTPLGRGRGRRDGDGVAADGLGASDVALLRQVLYAAGGSGHIAVTRAEAELLIAIDEATRWADNDPEWTDLYINALSNHLMWVSGYKPPSREEVLRRSKWLDERDGITGFFKKMVGYGPIGLFEAYTMQSPEDRALERLEEQHRALVMAEEITGPEASWLIERFQRDGTLSPNEKALLAVLKREKPTMTPELKALVAQL